MSDSEIEILEVHVDQDDVMDDLRDVLVQRRNEAAAPERVVNFDLPSVLVEEVLPGKLGEKDQKPGSGSGQRIEGVTPKEQNDEIRQTQTSPKPSRKV